MALVLIALANAWVGVRLPALLQNSSAYMLMEIERRIQHHPDRNAVTVLILGNSHAIGALRPAPLTEALRLPPHAVFNLSLPGGAAAEAQLLLRRYLPLFPNARRAIVLVDTYFVRHTMEIRMRYLTRFSWQERWQYAQQREALEDRVDLLLGQWFPLSDFREPLKESLARHPGTFLRRLYEDAPLEGSDEAHIASMDYPHGFPPFWEHRAIVRDLAAHAKMMRRWKFLVPRTRQLLPEAHELELGFEALDGCLRLLAEHGIRVQLVEAPYERRLLAAFKRYGKGRYETFQQRLGAYVKQVGHHMIEAPRNLETDDFVDADHVGALGARKVAVWTVERLDASWKQE